MRDALLAALLVVPFSLGMTAAAPAAGSDVVFTFQDPEIVESSGLVVRDGLAVTTNDSGDSGRVFVVEVATGETVGVTSWPVEPEDVEALAPAGAGTVWVGDVGDNNARRPSVRVARVEVGRGDRSGELEAYDLTYPGGPVNAETLLAHPGSGRLFIATKSVFGGTLYAAPVDLVADEMNELSPLGDVLPMATDGAFFPDGRHLIVRNYTQAAVYTFPDLAEVGSFTLPSQPQGEGIAVLADGSVLVSSEGQYSDVLSVELPAEIRDEMAGGPGSGSASGSASATPTPGGTVSREGSELPEQQPAERPVWPWFLTAWIALGGIVLFMFVVRRRG